MTNFSESMTKYHRLILCLSDQYNVQSNHRKTVCTQSASIRLEEQMSSLHKNVSSANQIGFVGNLKASM